ncbi:MAG: pseudouridine synthase [Thermoanaerobaculia bacterium]|nr:pseudouridine synthase [Thermoanaerobaculia bacterium]MBP9824493.1 pseudouridine synthase [Thermoanaerobaculia bacterium]
MTAERLQKILARAGVAARRKAENLITEGRVTVNGKVAVLGEKADPAVDSIKVDDKRIQAATSQRYLLLNKPRGYLTAVEDEAGRPTVMQLVPQHWRKALIPVGRLDYQTEGLLLLTDDGEFAQRISHPRYGCHKTYEVKVKGTPEEADLDRLRKGIVIEGKRTSPCRITWMKSTGSRDEEGGNTWFAVELSEGRTRQVREMFFRIAHPVQKLRRVAIGPLRDTELPVGALRELSDRELALLRKATEKVVAKATKPRAAKRLPAGLSERSTGTERPARAERPVRAERAERPVRPFRPQRTARVESPEADSRPARPFRADGAARPARPERPARAERPERAARATRAERPAAADRPSRKPRPAGSSRPDGARPPGRGRPAPGGKPRTSRPR